MKIITTAKFRPDSIEDDIWDSMSKEQKDETYEWTPYCFETNQIVSFNKSTNPIWTTIWFTSNDSITVRISFLDMLTVFPDAKQL
jgi:hypothetical protein